MTGHRAAAGRSTIYQQPDGSWRGEVSFGTDPATGRRLRRKVRGQTRDLVAKKVRVLERERDAGIRRASTRTVGSWLEEWIAGRELEVRRTTVHGYRSDLPHICRTLGRTRIEQLSPEQVEAMYRDCLAAGLSTGSIRHIRRTLSAAMTTAVDRVLSVSAGDEDRGGFRRWGCRCDQPDAWLVGTVIRPNQTKIAEKRGERPEHARALVGRSIRDPNHGGDRDSAVTVPSTQHQLASYPATVW